MTYANKIRLLVAVVVLLALATPLASFYGSKYLDTLQRPWAYSSDPATPLLVGAWRGTCTDPDHMAHAVEMTVYEPLTDEERWQRAYAGRSSRRKKSRKSNTFFDGMAVLNTHGRRDTCELWGGLEKASGHDLHFQLSPVSGVHPPGFNINLLKGRWQGDTITLTVSFAWFNADGSSSYDSADPRHNTDGHLVLVRSQ